MFMGGVSLPALADAIPEAEPAAVVEYAEPEAPAPEADTVPAAESDPEPDAEAAETTEPTVAERRRKRLAW